MADVPVETGSDGVQAAPRKLGRRTLDLVIAFSAIFISAVSLAVAIDNSRTQRELVAASTWPFVQRVLNRDNQRDIVIGVSNDGVGPAKIRNVELLLDGRPVASTLDLLRRCCGYRERTLPRGLSNSAVDNTVLRAGEENQIIHLRPSEANRQLAEGLSVVMPRLGFRSCYCSVLDQCWQSDLGTVSARRVKACPAPGHPFNPFGR